MKNALIILCLFFLIGSANAQSLPSSIVGSAGDYFNSSSGSLDWTLGEIMVETYKVSNGYFTQGFHQPETIKVTGLSEELAERLYVYPNPTKDFLNIKTVETAPYLFELFDMQGQKLDTRNVNGTGTQIFNIDLRDYRVAIYLLRITNSSTGKNSFFKIEKL